MIWVKMHHVNKVRAKGRTYYYHRPTGTRLPDDPTSVEFAERLAELNTGLGKSDGPARGSLDALIAHYKASPDFLGCAPKTRKDYRRYLDFLGEKFGDISVVNLDREFVIALRDELADKPRTANYVVSILRLLFSYAEDRPREFMLPRGWGNPARRPKRLKTGDGHRPWEEFEIEAFRRKWKERTVERVAFELLLNGGQRGGDTAAMTRHQYRRGELSVVQEKTGTRVSVPASADLRAVLDPWLEEHDHVVILATKSGGSFKIDHFRHTMRRAYREAGLPDDCTTHGLRYTAATVLKELGCDWETIGAITGHSTAEMVRKYTEKKRRARFAISRLDEARRERLRNESASVLQNSADESAKPGNGD